MISGECERYNSTVIVDDSVIGKTCQRILRQKGIESP